MAVTIANQIENHRAVYFEVTGDGVTTSFTVSHLRFRKPNHSITVTGVTAPTSVAQRQSKLGGLQFPQGGTAVALASTSINAATGVISITTSAAIANGTKAYFIAVFDQDCN